MPYTIAKRFVQMHFPGNFWNGGERKPTNGSTSYRSFSALAAEISSALRVVDADGMMAKSAKRSRNQSSLQKIRDSVK